MSSHSSFGSGSAKSRKTVTMSKSKFAPKKEAKKMADKDIPVEIITQVDINQESIAVLETIFIFVSWYVAVQGVKKKSHL